MYSFLPASVKIFFRLSWPLIHSSVANQMSETEILANEKEQCFCLGS